MTVEPRRHGTVWRWGPSARVVILLTSTLVIYVPALGGGYLWDDALYVRENPALRSLAGLSDIWRIPPTTRQYYPLTFTSFWAEYQLWGDQPFGYHTTNVILHGANALLVWRLLAALEVPGAFVAAWLFAVHPVHVESVAWIAERKNVLSGLFALIAALAWVRFLADGRRGRLIVTTVAFAAALLGKTQVCTLPVVLLLLAWWKRPGQWRRFVFPLAPLLALGVAAAVITVLCEPSAMREALPLPQLRLAERGLVAGHALWFYAASLWWPHNLVAIYGHWRIDLRAYGAYGFPLAAAALLAALWAARRRLGNGPIVALAAFVAGVAPILGFVDFNFMRFAFVADHFQYLASIPLLALGAATGARGVELVAARVPGVRGLGPPLATAVGLGLAALSWQRAAVHRSEEALWRDNIARRPDAAAYNHLGNVLLAQRRLDEASAAFAAATRLDAGFADAHNNWASVLKEQGRLDEARAHYTEALRINPADPVVHNNLGVALQMQGESAAAIAHFAEAIRLDARYAPPHNNWGATLFARGDATAAIDQYATAVRLQPAYAEADDNWGVALLALGRPDEAAQHFAAAAQADASAYNAQEHWGEALQQLGRDAAAAEHYRAAVRLDPARARAQRGLGIALLGLGRADQAIDALTAAATIEPTSADAHHHLGVALGMAGMVDAALAHLAVAARLDPGDADIQNHWGVALTFAGRLDDAVARFQEALRLRPDHPEARDNLARALAQRDAARPQSRPPPAD